MYWTAWLLVCIAAVAVVVVMSRMWFNQRCAAAVRGMVRRGGSLHEVSAKRGQTIREVVESVRTQTNGEPVFKQWLFWYPMLAIRCPEVAREVLVKRNWDFVRTTFIPSREPNVVTAEGDDARRHRRIVQRSLQRDFLKQTLPLIVGALQREIAEVEHSNFGQRRDNDTLEVNDVMKWTERVVQRVISHVTYGPSDVIFRANHTIQSGLMFSAVAAYLPFLRYLPLEAVRRQQRAREDLQVLDELISAARKREIDDDTPLSLLECLAMASDRDDEGLSVEEIKSNLLALGIGGNDSTCSALTTCLAMLASHSDFQEELRAEVSDIVVEDLHRFGGGLEKLKKTSLFIKECLRMYPPFVSCFFRTPLEPMEIGGTAVDSRHWVGVSLLNIHRNEKYWEEPDRFCPHRFKAAEQDGHRVSNEAFMPFGLGPRSCIAQRLAIIILKSTIALLLKQYRVVRAADDGEIEFTSGHVIQPSKALSLRFVPLAEQRS